MLQEETHGTHLGRTHRSLTLQWKHTMTREGKRMHTCTYWMLHILKISHCKEEVVSAEAYWRYEMFALWYVYLKSCIGTLNELQPA